MCLIDVKLQKTNLPTSVLGWKSVTIDGDELYLLYYGDGPMYFNKTYKAIRRELETVSFSDAPEKAYTSGFHIYKEYKSAADGYADPVICVGWGLTSMGYNGYYYGKPEDRTYVCNYIRFFKSETEARKFKKQLDAKKGK